MDAIARLRTDYTKGALDDEHADPDPIRQFTRWWDEATRSQLREANAMIARHRRPRGPAFRPRRAAEGLRRRGFVFFTNYTSRKGRELADNPRAALLFFWSELERQVRIEGTVEHLAPGESDEYYRSRPLASRIGAWASPQSELIPSKAWLLARAAEMGLSHGLNPARPPHWGGYRVSTEPCRVLAGAAVATARPPAVFLRGRGLGPCTARAVGTVCRGRGLNRNYRLTRPMPARGPAAIIGHSRDQGVG